MTTEYSVDEVRVAIESDYRYGWDGLRWGGDTLNLRGKDVVIDIVDRTGGEDEGSHASTTFKIGDQYFQKQGYYASHYGYDWDGDFLEVRPVEKTVIVYGPYEKKDN